MPLCDYCEENESIEDGMCQTCIDHFKEEDAHRTCAVVDCNRHIPVGHDFCEEHAHKLNHATLIQ